MKYLFLIICSLFALTSCTDDLDDLNDSLKDINESVKEINETKDDLINDYYEHYEYSLIFNTLKSLAIKKQIIILDDFKYIQGDVYDDMSLQGLVNNIVHLNAIEVKFKLILETYSEELKNDLLNTNNSLITLGYNEITQYEMNTIYTYVIAEFSNFIDDDILPDYNYFNSYDLNNFNENLHIILDDDELIFNNNY